MKDAKQDFSEKNQQDNELAEVSATNLFPIRELSLQTGVNSVTLRAWERRYGLLKPKRTGKGHRLYDQADVVRVEAIMKWIQQGVAVSKVRALLDQSNEQESMAVGVQSDNEWQQWREDLVAAANQYQESKIEQLYQQIFSQYPAEIAVRDWLMPSLEMIPKGAELAFTESVLLACLSNRISSMKVQQKAADKEVLITGLSCQRLLSAYVAAAMLLDKGVRCQLIMTPQHYEDWCALVQHLKVDAVLAFCENELANRVEDVLDNMLEWQTTTVAVGASFWLAANDLSKTKVGQVSVMSDSIEGIRACIEELSR
ncbi:MerR family transcriptional regulator [Marinomonas posidonica]|uniref:MerR family transcriptional regulator n=1 Tax=Marinomonas posidonica TaxID=936476 RepID=UPI00373571A9